MAKARRPKGKPPHGQLERSSSAPHHSRAKAVTRHRAARGPSSTAGSRETSAQPAPRAAR